MQELELDKEEVRNVEVEELSRVVRTRKGMRSRKKLVCGTEFRRRKYRGVEKEG